MKVFKYSLPILGETEVMMPIGARVLSIDLQRGVPQIWALVNDGNDLEKRCFLIAATGEKITYVAPLFIGTIQMDNGFVFHCFEIHK